MVNVKDVELGTTTRKSFAKINEVMQMPNLIQVQKESYQWFLDKGIKEVFRDIGSIKNYDGSLELKFIDYSIDDPPKYTIAECKARDASYAKPLKVTVVLENHETGEISEHVVFMGELPLMTDAGTFVINGAERCIVSQLVRSPGVYYHMEHDKTGKELYTNTVIPLRGAWLEYETDANDIFYVRIDKTRKINITTFLRALGLSTDTDIREFFGDDERIEATIEKDNTKNQEEALLEVYKKLRPGEPAILDTAKAHLESLFFDTRRYDLSRVGRYKFNKKLGMADRLANQVVSQPVIAPESGEILANAGDKITPAMAKAIEDAGVMFAYVSLEGGEEIKVVSNGMVDIRGFIPSSEIDWDALGINEKVSYRVLGEILEKCDADDIPSLEAEIRMRHDDLIPNHIIVDDIFATVSYLCNLAKGVGTTDDIDHLGNRRIRTVGELLQNQFRIGFTRMEKTITERMITSVTDEESEKLTANALVNPRPVVSAIKEFFGSSPLSQFMDQNNPLAELTHKRRLSALGPGGLSRDRAGFEVRDVHYTHYGRMCPIETPEGPNIGLISYLACYSRLNEYGFIEAPYRKIDKKTGVVTDEVVYMTADMEDEFIVAQANEPLDEEGRFANNRVLCRHKDEFLTLEPEKIDYMDVSPKMVVSVATAMIPFLENDDANRALMGANMQRQAVPLLKTEAPVVGTGMEYKAAYDSGVVVIAKRAGKVVAVDARTIEIQTADGSIDKYDLIKFAGSNQGTCINQRPIVTIHDEIKEGQVIADGPATAGGEVSLGKNALIGFMTWEGYNYEDAVLINEKIVREDVYTSIHIIKHDQEARDTKLGPEEITKDIPNIPESAIKDLDDEGIIRIGAEVKSGDILVGKVTPKGETDMSAEDRLLYAIFGEKAREVRDTSLKVPHGEYGIVVDVQVFTRANCDELSPGVNKRVRVYIAQKRKIQAGDKMAGRHGNKGVVSRVLPQEDMPFLPDGRPLDIVLNPLGVPSRMNIGQVLEVHLGYAAKALGWKMMTPVFDGAHEDDIRECLKLADLGYYEDENGNRVFDGKTQLIDGRTGEPFDNRVTVGYMYYLKLHHLVDDKMHARSIGPYSLVTQQPLGGKAQFGGQRFGEMEVWALEAYGAAYTLQEIITVKSDDMSGREKTYEAIVKGQNIPPAGIPEAFKVLFKEFQALGLDTRLYDKAGEEVELRQREEEEGFVVDDKTFTEVNDYDETTDGFSVVDGDEEEEAADDVDLYSAFADAFAEDEE